MKILSKTIFPGDYVEYPNTLGLFVAEPRLGSVKYVFDFDFIHLTRYSLSSGCTSEFTTPQLEFFTSWLEYQVALMNGVTTYPEDSPIVAFDAELISMAECIDNSDQIICGNAALHTYVACPIV